MISNASDALDKIRLLSLTDQSALAATEEMSIKIKVERDANVIHITDTGVGMSQAELKKNLGTIAKSGTSDFFENMSVAGNEDSASDLIGQFGVGFYSAFLVADKVVVTSKSNSDDQYVWESDSVKFSVAKDPRGNTLQRGTTISLYLKEEAGDYLQHQSVKVSSTFCPMEFLLNFSLGIDPKIFSIYQFPNLLVGFKDSRRGRTHRRRSR